MVLVRNSVLALLLVGSIAGCGVEEGTVNSALTEDKAAKIPEISGDYRLYHRIISLTHTFDLYDNKKAHQATITQHIFSWGRSFTLENTEGIKWATAKQKVFTWGVEIDVFDADDIKIATIKENIWKSLLKWETEYEILDAKGEKIASSRKTEWLGTKMFVYADGKEVLKMERPFFRLRDYWTIHIPKGSTIDPRVVLFLGAYKSAVDQDRSTTE